MLLSWRKPSNCSANRKQLRDAQRVDVRRSLSKLLPLFCYKISQCYDENHLMGFASIIHETSSAQLSSPWSCKVLCFAFSADKSSTTKGSSPSPQHVIDLSSPKQRAQPAASGADNEATMSAFQLISLKPKQRWLSATRCRCSRLKRSNRRGLASSIEISLAHSTNPLRAIRQGMIV